MACSTDRFIPVRGPTVSDGTSSRSCMVMGSLDASQKGSATPRCAAHEVDACDGGCGPRGGADYVPDTGDVTDGVTDGAGAVGGGGVGAGGAPT